MDGDLDSPHCPGCQLTRRQWAGLRAALAVPGDWPDERVPDAMLAALAADKVVADELAYLGVAMRLGWAWWTLDA